MDQRPADATRASREPPPQFQRGGGVGSVVMALPRAACTYAKEWQRYVLPRRPDEEVPVVRPTLALAGQALLDEVFLGLGAFLFSRIPTDSLERIEDEARAAVEMYTTEGWLQTPERFHPAPPPLTDPDLQPTQNGRVRFTRLAFESGYEPHPDEPGRERWLGYEANRHTSAWVLRHDEPRPWLVCCHAAQMGRPSIDFRLFRAPWLHEELGLNVVMPVQPLHGPRRRGIPFGTRFPGVDLVDDIHGAAQAVWDIRRVLSWVRHTDPGSPIGITGISLGAWPTLLVASLDDGLSSAIVGAPAVDLAHVLEGHSGGHAEAYTLFALARELNPVVSPMAMTPRVPYEGRFIYAGLADQLAHPRRQVVRLWQHWGRHAIEWYTGGHTGFARSKSVRGFIGQALVDSGLVARTDAEQLEPAGA